MVPVRWVLEFLPTSRDAAVSKCPGTICLTWDPLSWKKSQTTHKQVLVCRSLLYCFSFLLNFTKTVTFTNFYLTLMRVVDC